MKDELDSLLQKQMDRKSFLKHVGMGFVAITGLAALLKSLNGLGGTATRSVGYGSSTYGDKKPSDPSPKA